jgi:ferrous iron transport protein B
MPPITDPTPQLYKTIALIGNPNCGKTTLFNALTHRRESVGNWPGVTVEKVCGSCCHHTKIYNITDLPGIYSLTDLAHDEAVDQQITRSYVYQNEADLYLNIIDATHLKRNLYLTLQLLELERPCIIVLTMTDKTQAQHQALDLTVLSHALGVPILSVITTQKDSVLIFKQRLFESIQQSQMTIQTPQRHAALPWPEWLHTHLPAQNPGLFLQSLELPTPKPSILLPADLTEDVDILIAQWRYASIDTLIKTAQRADKLHTPLNTHKPHPPTQWLDQIVLHRLLGIPLFLLMMYGLFQSSISLGELCKPFFEGLGAHMGDGIMRILQGIGVTFLSMGLSIGVSEHFFSLLHEGLNSGLSTLLGFIPQIGLLFFLLSVLEDSGYMTRAAFVMDRLMQALGLPGQSFVPLLVGFGCNVPAILSTRTLHQTQNRILTCMMIPFMSCSARLTIFVVFADLFFKPYAGLMVFLLYCSGMAIAILTGVILKQTVLKLKSSAFVLEMPDYHAPNLKNALKSSAHRTRQFILRAGKLIIPFSILLVFCTQPISISSMDTRTQEAQNTSVLTGIAQTLTPLFQPIGISPTQWQLTLGLMSGGIAKEVVMGTLNTLYDPNRTTSTETPPTTLQNAFNSPFAAFSYCLFILLYIPCLSTYSALKQEIGRGWAWISLLWSVDIAYSAALCVYQMSQITTTPVYSTLAMGMVILWHTLLGWWVSTRQDVAVARVPNREGITLC